MTDLVDFLLARIAEDEAAATATGGQEWSADVPGMIHADPQGRAKSRYVGSAEYEVDRQHIVRWQPARVLAECEAKRRIIEDHPLTGDVVPVHTGPNPGVGCETCHTVTASSIDDVDYVEALGPCDTLLALALPYADHPDYQREWRP